MLRRATPVRQRENVHAHVDDVCAWPQTRATACAQSVYLRSDELVEVWGDVEENAVYGAGQGDPAEEQDEQHEVGVRG